MSHLFAAIDWMQVLATVVPVLVSGTTMFLWLAWILGRRIERLFVVVATVDKLGTRVDVIEVSLSTVRSDIGALQRSSVERREDFLQIRQMFDQLMLRNSQS